jgi:hypothetical protein
MEIIEGISFLPLPLCPSNRPILTQFHWNRSRLNKTRLHGVCICFHFVQSSSWVETAKKPVEWPACAAVHASQSRCPVPILFLYLHHFALRCRTSNRLSSMYEIDSLCGFLKLSRAYYGATKDALMNANCEFYLFLSPILPRLLPRPHQHRFFVWFVMGVRCPPPSRFILL